MERYVCIHGHFYQPPRENPWLEVVERQDSAYPYPDWNARINAECYEPNASARILDGEGRIEHIANNYARMSFNVGPTLLSWLEAHAPDTYQGILEADRQSQERFSGHGSAIAQVYNHMIMPLANARDKRTQVHWGVRDFERRFGRRPEGMWLAETAVDLDSLEALADAGIQYTILTQYQIRRARPIGSKTRGRGDAGSVDPTRPYRIELPSGRSLAVFAYDGPISRAVAFEGLLTNGGAFAERIASGFHDGRRWPQLMHIATDGESYGHHHRHGEMALAYALRHFEQTGLARITNYGEHLERHPPTHAVELVENTSWSCAHGIERWRSNCGCNSGGHAWHQEWRGPLRAALDALRDELAPLFEKHAHRYFADPWAVRDAYIDVILDRSPQAVNDFLTTHAGRALNPEETVEALELLEIQRQAQLMYTSCGWFFDELSGIETVQVMMYAGRAVQLAERRFGEGVEASFLTRLSEAKSNLPEHGDGSLIYQKWVRPSRVELIDVGDDYALSSLFEEYPAQSSLYRFDIEREDYQKQVAGKARVAVGRIRLSSRVTRASARLSFGVIYFGEHNVMGGVREFQGDEAYAAMSRDVLEAFAKGDFPGTLRCIDKHFGGAAYSLRSLFRDQQERVLSFILADAVADAEAGFRRIFESQEPLVLFLGELGVPVPRPFAAAAEVVLNRDLRSALEDNAESEGLDPAHVRPLLERVRRARVPIDAAGLAYAAKITIETLLGRLRDQPTDVKLQERAKAAIELLGELPFEVDLGSSERLFYEAYQRLSPAHGGDAALLEASRARLQSVGERLRVRT